MAVETATVKGEDGWQPARLIPTSGIKGVDEQEKRATSALLSVMMAVPDFSRSLLKKVGAPSGGLKAYIEPEFTLESGSKTRPDGALIARRGSTTWKALVEVKTGSNELAREQIETYLGLARDHEFDAVITISNQMGTAAEAHPLVVDRRKTSRVQLVHWSWVEILTEAVLQREHRGVADPDQAWILGELIAYLKHPQSGAMQFQDMGQHWVTVREAARDGTLRLQDPGITEVALKWDQFVQYLCLHLAGDLGVEVRQILTREEQMKPATRRQNLMKELVQNKTLSGVIRVKNAAGPITLTASLASRMVSAAISMEAPSEGKALTRVNWLVRQLKTGNDQLHISTAFGGSRDTASARLQDLRDNPGGALLSDKSKMPRSFTVTAAREMGTKRGGVSGSFIGEATGLLLSFYRDVVQGLKPWTSSVPRLPVQDDPGDIAKQPANVVEAAASEAQENDAVLLDDALETAARSAATPALVVGPD